MLALGDAVTVTRIDRLAGSHLRPVRHRQVKRMIDANAQFRSLAEPWADIGTSTGRLMLAVLVGLAGAERDLIRAPTTEGRSRDKAQGKHMGRPPAQQKEAIRRRAQGATLQEFRGQLRPQDIHHAPRHPHRLTPMTVHLDNTLRVS
jgi:DNA invertase Pin-like site-specific DNA recombinase